MRIVHRRKAGRRDGGADPADMGDSADAPSEETRTVLAPDATIAESFLAKARGLMFRDSVPPGGGLIFPFDHPVNRTVHMFFVRFPIDVVFLVRGRVQRVETLAPWLGFARARADTIIELPAGQASDVERGDPVMIEPAEDAD
ncbi:MAG: DUF192 domain-containing protein, partial [Halobacteriales archaeon]|nr:DUF192 domain-containing protein [Halobacteriales archaeon]